MLLPSVGLLCLSPAPPPSVRSRPSAPSSRTPSADTITASSPGSLPAIERGSVSATLRSPARESWQLQSRQRGSYRRARRAWGGRSRDPPELAHPPTHRFAQPVEIVSLVGNLDVLFDVKMHVGDVVPREVLHGGGEDAL